MSYSIHLTSEWPLERLERYRNDITKAMNAIYQRFPDDVRLCDMARDIARGERQLWLILDENEDFAAFVTSEIETTKSGKKRVLLLELAGEGGALIADMVQPIEQWARTIGADELCPIGRIGWSKILRQHGFLPDVVKYRKELK